MKILFVFLLSCAPVFGAEGDIRVVTTTQTNAETASIVAKDCYIRDGQTNMVRQTNTKGGVTQIRIHWFYHAGTLVGDYVAMPDFAGFTAQAGTPYSVSLRCDASSNPKSLVIVTREGVVLDAFTYTNGVFAPVESPFLTKLNAASLEIRRRMEERGNSSK